MRVEVCGPSAYSLTMRHHTIALALLLAACGDDTTIVNNYGTGGSSPAAADSSAEASSGNGSGGSGGDGAGTAATTSGVTSVTSTSGHGGSGDGGAGGSGGDAGSGSTGGGLACEAAACVEASDSTVINCEPTCGALDPRCDLVCHESTLIDLEFLEPGQLLEVRTPIVLEQHESCADLCGSNSNVAWALRMRMAPEMCVEVTGPADALYVTERIDAGETQPSTCDASGGTACTKTFRATQGTEVYLVIGLPRNSPNPGSHFTILPRDVGNCPLPTECPGGCNGDGA